MTGMENAQTDLKSSRPLDRADYIQTGTNPEWDDYVNTNTFQTGLSFGTTHARQSPVKKQQLQAREINQ